jgi:hypothetical protein
MILTGSIREGPDDWFSLPADLSLDPELQPAIIITDKALIIIELANFILVNVNKIKEY